MKNSFPMWSLKKIKEVKSNPNNPRLIKDENFKRLVQSIKDFPKMLQLRPIVVNKDMMVLGGNMRLKACIEAGLTEVPIIMAEELTEDEQRRFIITDNNSFGEYDWDIIANEWGDLPIEDWGVDLPEYKEYAPENKEKEIDNSLSTEHECPSCGYKW